MVGDFQVLSHCIVYRKYQCRRRSRALLASLCTTSHCLSMGYAQVGRRQCLVLADGFYEWKKAGVQNISIRIILSEGEPFAFAGALLN